MKNEGFQLETMAVWLRQCGGKRVAVLTHIRADGDTLGSGLALCAALRHLGAEAELVNPAEIPLSLRFLVGGRETLPANGAYDLVVAVDVASASMLEGLEEGLIQRVDGVIDHHAVRSLQAPVMLVDGESAATGELIYDLICAMQVPVNTEIAAALYTALATDTGCFCFSNTTAKTHRIAAALLEHPFDAARYNRLLFETKTRARLALEAGAFAAVEYVAEGEIALMPLSLQLMERVCATADDAEGIAGVVRTIEGVELGIVAKETEKDLWKISMRSFGKYNAAAACSLLGGGGHRCAAGARVSGTWEQVRRRLIEVGMAGKEP